MGKQNTSYWNKQNKKIEICETPIWFMVLTFAPVNSASPELCRNLLILFKLFFKQFWNCLNFVSNNKHYLQNFKNFKKLTFKNWNFRKANWNKFRENFDTIESWINSWGMNQNLEEIVKVFSMVTKESGYSWNFLF